MDHSYTMTQWQDAPSTETPLSAENLNHIEQGIGALYHDVGVLEESLSTFIVADLLPTETQESSEGSYISAHDYSIDDLMIIGPKVYKALSAIAIGDSIIVIPTSGSAANVSEISLGEAIMKLAGDGGGGDTPDISELVARVSTLENAVATRSHIGQIVQSTTLDTMSKVIAAYGGTTWIQHSGYFLYGAASGVTPNSATDDGGEATHMLTENEMPSHTHTQDQHQHNLGQRSVYVGNGSAIAVVTIGGGSDQNGLTGYATPAIQATGGGYPHNNMPPYKNVYIWERTA